jgi:hypothetical protein
MKKNTVVNIGILAFVAGSLTYVFKDNIFWTRKRAENIFFKKFSVAAPKTFETGYLIEWAKAINNNTVNFYFKNKNYSSLTGKSL